MSHCWGSRLTLFGCSSNSAEFSKPHPIAPDINLEIGIDHLRGNLPGEGKRSIAP
jgi:hypothetical protein